MPTLEKFRQGRSSATGGSNPIEPSEQQAALIARGLASAPKGSDQEKRYQTLLKQYGPAIPKETLQKYGLQAPEGDTSILGGVLSGAATALDYIDRPAAFIRAGTQGAIDTLQGKENLLEPWKRGFNAATGQQDAPTFTQLRTQNPNAKPEGVLGWATELAGSAALDPLTYLSVGAKPLATTGLRSVAAELGPEVAQSIAKRGVEKTVQEGVQDVTRQSIKDALVKQALEKGALEGKAAKGAERTIKALETAPGGVRFAGQRIPGTKGLMAAKLTDPAATVVKEGALNTARNLFRTNVQTETRFGRGVSGIAAEAESGGKGLATRIAEEANKEITTTARKVSNAELKGPLNEALIAFADDPAKGVALSTSLTPEGQAAFDAAVNITRKTDGIATNTGATIPTLAEKIAEGDSTALRAVLDRAVDAGKVAGRAHTYGALSGIQDDLGRQITYSTDELFNEAVPTATGTSRRLGGPAAGEGLPPLYHGTGSPIIRGGPVSGGGRSAENLFGPGFYSTADEAVAGTYQAKGVAKSPMVYGVKWGGESAPVVLNMEEALPSNMRPLMEDWVRTSLAAEHMDLPVDSVDKLHTLLADPTTTGSDFYKAIRDTLHGEVSRSEADDIIYGLNDRFLNAGYDAFKYQGGTRTGNKLHDAFVFLDPDKVKTNLRIAEEVKPGVRGPVTTTANTERVAKLAEERGLTHVQAGNTEIWVPKEIAADVNKTLTSIELDPGVRAFNQRIGQANQLWRAYATVFPSGLGFFTRNGLGNVLNMFYAGVHPKEFAEALRLTWKQNKGTLSEAEKALLDKAIQHNIIESGYFLRETSGSAQEAYRATEQGAGRLGPLNQLHKISPVNPENIPLRAGRAINTGIENNARLALFLDGMNKGMAPVDAAQRVKKFLFDYTSLSEAERTKIKPWVAFYTFMRKNIPLQFSTLIHEPGKVAVQMHAIKAGQLGPLAGGQFAPGTGGIPSGTQQGLGAGDIPIGNSLIGADLPLLSAADTVAPWLKAAKSVSSGEAPDIKELAGSLIGQTSGVRAALSKGAVEAATGKSLFTGGDLKTNMDKWDQALNELFPGKTKSELLVKRIKKIASGEDRGQLLSVLAGLREMPVNAQQKTYEDLARVARLNQIVIETGALPSLADIRALGLLPTVKNGKVTNARPMSEAERTGAISKLRQIQSLRSGGNVNNDDLRKSGLLPQLQSRSKKSRFTQK